jgi:hypothetical protein
LQLTSKEVCAGKAYRPCLWPVPFKNTLGWSGVFYACEISFFSVVLYVVWAVNTFYFRLVIQEIPTKLWPVERPCCDKRFMFFDGISVYVFSHHHYCWWTLCSTHNVQLNCIRLSNRWYTETFRLTELNSRNGCQNCT